MLTEDIVVSHMGWIRDKAGRYYDNSRDAEDLACETIYKCLSQPHRFDSDLSFKPWALAIMQNTFITQYNRKCRVLFSTLLPDESYEGSEYTDQRACVKLIMSAIKNLVKTSRSIECVLLYAKGYTYYEISSIVGIPVGTVKSRVAAGRKKIREAIEQE